MRPLVFAILTALLVVPTTDAAAQLRIGARGGATGGRVQAETGQRSQEIKRGILAGAYVERGLAGRLGVQLGAQFAQKGIREVFSVQGIPNPIELELEIGYLELPVMLVYPLRAVGPFTLFVNGGVAPAFRVQCESTAETEGRDALSGKCGEDDPDAELMVNDVKSFDVSANLVAALGVEIGRARVTGEWGYSWGLIPFIVEDPDEAEAEVDLKHRVTSITFTVSIPIGREPTPLDFDF
jgi:hypothetical protein